jgi:hypothetical protein
MLILEQDGNWLQGIHKGDYSMQDVVGIIEGDQVKLSSTNRQPGDSIKYLFSATVSGKSMSGSIFMGEYLTADFTAKKIDYNPKQEKIMIPGGPPLAT